MRPAFANEVRQRQGHHNVAMHPAHALDAAAHRDPYPYYASLLARAPLIHDPAMGLWIAARASTVSEVFDNPACRVRPQAEPIPLALAGSSAGEVFGRLVRMNDGAGQRRAKVSLERALLGVPAAQVRARTWHLASLVLPDTTDGLNDWVFRTPVAVVADLLGFPHAALPEIARLVRDFVACLSPQSTSVQREQASAAATRLQAALLALLHAEHAQDSLANRVRQAADAATWRDEPALLANLVGLLSQTYEATAGLLGNSLVALASHPGLLQRVRARHDGWQQLVQETSRHDPSVQNTRRFVWTPTRIAGIDLPAGATILLVLAAANRDPQVNPRPEAFLLDRPQRRVFSFSRGAHACPGQALATRIVSTALARLFETRGQAFLAGLQWAYLPSGNGRLPSFLATDPI